MRVLASFCLTVTLGIAAPLAAQQPSAARLDVMVGGSAVRGGTIDAGGMVDALAAGRVRPMPRGALVVGLGASGIVSGFGDKCRLLPKGGCAEKGNFAVVTALFGVDRAVRAGSLRLLAGPSYYNGEKDGSLGLQGRLDVASPAFAHLALGLMTRATLLPKHDDATLVIWGFGFGITFR